MADNFTANAGAGGDTFGADDILGVKFPRSKLIFGADGTNSGDVAIANGLPVQPATGATWAATQSGTWNITNVSGTVSLPTGAATAAKQPALGTAGAASADVISVQGIASMTALKVDGSAVTQPVSAASLPLPSGASTAAKQPALGTAGAASSDVITIQGIASMTAVKVDGSAVTQPVSGTVSITANSAVNVAQINGVAPSMGNGVSGTGVQRVTLASDSTGQVALAAGTASVGSVALEPKTSGGLTTNRLISAATTNATNVKGSAGQVYGVTASNTNAAARYLKLYNKATAPTVGTDTPTHTFLIPPNSSGLHLTWDNGLAFGTGIGFALTTGVADSDTGAVAANEIVAHVYYK